MLGDGYDPLPRVLPFGVSRNSIILREGRGKGEVVGRVGLRIYVHRLSSTAQHRNYAKEHGLGTSPIPTTVSKKYFCNTHAHTLLAKA